MYLISLVFACLLSFSTSCYLLVRHVCGDCPSHLVDGISHYAKVFINMLYSKLYPNLDLNNVLIHFSLLIFRLKIMLHTIFLLM